MAGRRAKRSEIWVLGEVGVSISCTQGIFDTSVLNIILESFCAFLIFEKPVSQKRRIVDNRSEIWASGVSIWCIQGTFDT